MAADGRLEEKGKKFYLSIATGIIHTASDVDEWQHRVALHDVWVTTVATSCFPLDSSTIFHASVGISFDE